MMLRTACYFSLDSNVFSSIKSRIVVLACSGSVGQASMSLANSGSFCTISAKQDAKTEVVVSLSDLF